MTEQLTKSYLRLNPEQTKVWGRKIVYFSFLLYDFWFQFSRGVYVKFAEKIVIFSACCGHLCLIFGVGFGVWITLQQSGEEIGCDSWVVRTFESFLSRGFLHIITSRSGYCSLKKNGNLLLLCVSFTAFWSKCLSVKKIVDFLHINIFRTRYLSGFWILDFSVVSCQEQGGFSEEVGQFVC